MSKKISIITPSYHSGKHIEEAINSVLNQEYENVEHIVVDGGSEDNTVEILQKYPHVKWVSEPDNGQSHAMNKGFAMSSGDIIGYLNADDYYLPGAFKNVLHYFEADGDFVVGKVKVLLDDGSSWINDPKVTHWDMLHHWRPDAFCVNPAGYFYTRRVQEKVKGFNEANDRTMDLEFLLTASRDFEIEKVNRLLGVFRLSRSAKTILFGEDENIWTTGFFSYIDTFIAGLPPEKREQFNKEREEGYLLRKKWQKENQKITPPERLLKELDRKEQQLAQKENRIDHKEQQLQQKEQQVENKDMQLRQKDERIAEKDRQIKEKDQQIEKKNEQLRQKDEQLSNKEQQLQQKDQQVENKDMQLRQKDEQIRQKDEQLSNKDRQIKEKEQQLRQKDQQIENKDGQLRQKDERTAEKDRQIGERDRQLAGNEQQLREKDRQLQERDEQLAGKDRELKEKNRQLAEKIELLKKSSRDLQQKSRELEQKDARLAQVLNSKSFRIGKFILSPFALIKRIIRFGTRK